ncbi:hypothetical protein SDC9_83555 [bioreactor metagenome]|uniref:Uncharacterized protein n=1 Tax=bioreactor metagenome TaxID=1076179 RepID=A0A644ZAN8_9ZZZZ|nr:hypothetical protein [Christensenella sp.]
MQERDEKARAALIAYFSQNGLLLCNENARMPFLEIAGGNWNAIVSLMESGDVFYSRLYQHRVTYLSRSFYYLMKPYRQREHRLDAPCVRLLAFLRAAGEANAEQMQTACLLEKKAQGKALEQLVSELLVTVSRRDKTIHDSWCTFYYCPAERWEEKQTPPTNEQIERAHEWLHHSFTQKQIQSLLSHPEHSNMETSIATTKI